MTRIRVQVVIVIHSNVVNARRPNDDSRRVAISACVAAQSAPRVIAGAITRVWCVC